MLGTVAFNLPRKTFLWTAFSLLIGFRVYTLLVLYPQQLTEFHAEISPKQLLTYEAQANKLHSFVQASNTIVTAYYQTPTARHPLEFYWEQLDRLCSCHDAMVIFTSPDLVADISALRASKPKHTLIIPMDLSETRMAKLNDTTYWNRLGTAGSHAHYTTYWIWNEKVEYLKKVSDLNPFQSNFFAWFDAGMVRWDEYTNTTLLQRIPPELDKDRMLVLNITRITTSRSPRLMVGAGIFGGYKRGVDWYHERFYQIMQEQYEGNSTMLASEQHLMYKTCIDTPGLCFTVRPAWRRHGYGPAVKYAMFFLLAFFNSDDYQKMNRNGLIQDEFGDYSLP